MSEAEDTRPTVPEVPADPESFLAIPFKNRRLIVVGPTGTSTSWC